MANPEYHFYFFFHAWILNDKQRFSASPWRNLGEQELTFREDCVQDLMALYQPQAYEFEKSIDHFDDTVYQDSIAWHNSTERKKQNIHNTLSQLYSKNKVRDILQDHMAKSGETYETVIMCRFDYTNKIPLLLNTVDLRLTHVSSCIQHINDALPTVFCVSPINVFLRWFTTFSNLENLVNNRKVSAQFGQHRLVFDMNLEELETANYLYFFGNLDNVCFSQSILDFRVQ